jgi:hypothetical protein
MIEWFRNIFRPKINIENLVDQILNSTNFRHEIRSIIINEGLLSNLVDKYLETYNFESKIEKVVFNKEFTKEILDNFIDFMLKSLSNSRKNIN